MDSEGGGQATPPADVGCALCGESLDPVDDLVLQCYPERERTVPAVAAADGFVGVCDACATEIDELVAAWRDHGPPPVAADHSIAGGYRRVAADCSFCERELGGEPLLGVEYYRPGAVDDAPDGSAGADYSLCHRCVPVFDRFLEQVRADAAP